jgi:hypothetical protein
MLDLDECIERCCNMEILEQEEVVQLCERLKQILMVLPRAPAPALHPHVTRCPYTAREPTGLTVSHHDTALRPSRAPRATPPGRAKRLQDLFARDCRRRHPRPALLKSPLYSGFSM